MPKRKVAPSEPLAKRIEELVENAQERSATAADLLGELARLGAQRVIQEALEHEQAEHLERDRYERRLPGSAPLYRNGYEPGRVQIGEGEIEVQRPQVRGGGEPYRSGIWELTGRWSGEVERLVVEMYARGLSTRDIEDVFRGPDGEVLLSKASVSEMTDRLWEEYEAFSERDLSGLSVVYLIVDGVYEAMRRLGHVRDGILVAWAILEDGRRVLVHLELGNRESYDSCLSFLHGLKRRGLAAPLLVVSDGAPGLVRAIEEAFPLSLRQRCLAHKKRNVLAKVPEADQAAVGAFLSAIYHAPNPEIARTLADQFVEKYQHPLPTAVRTFLDDLEACLAQLRCPEVHRKAIRTTNVIERAFEELRRRTKVIPRFFDERSCLKLAYAELIRAGQRSRRVRMSDIELRHIQLLRAEIAEERGSARRTRKSAAGGGAVPEHRRAHRGRLSDHGGRPRARVGRRAARDRGDRGADAGGKRHGGDAAGGSGGMVPGGGRGREKVRLGDRLLGAPAVVTRAQSGGDALARGTRDWRRGCSVPGAGAGA